MIRFTPRPPRFYLAGHRIHHGLVGAILLLSDARDWRVRLRDLAR